MPVNQPTTLLIVDDEMSVCRALFRMIGHRFDQAILAFNPLEAKSVLDSQSVTHLLCDYHFGPGEPMGTELAVAWRNTYPTICRVVILTGADIHRLVVPPQIDALVEKTATREELVHSLAL